MYTRVTRFTNPEPLTDARIAEAAQRMSETFGQTPGYLGWSALVDHASGKAISVTYWADAASMQASEDAGAALRGHVISQGAQLIDLERYELLIQERVAPPSAGTFVRLTQLTLAPERIDELMAVMTQTSVPQTKALPGFRSFLVSANRAAGKVLVATVWESTAAREASDAAVRDERRQTAERVGASVVSVEPYEVAAVDLKLPAPA